VLDLDGGWIDYRRGKTGVKRRCPLWPETIEAIAGRLPLCRITGNVFSTSDGARWFRGRTTGWRRGSRRCARPPTATSENRGFYALRHLFSTEAVKHGSTMLVKRITGHTSGEEDRVLDEHYVGGVDAKLCEIVNAVRHAVLSEWPGARLEAALPAAPLPEAIRWSRLCSWETRPAASNRPTAPNIGPR
jgi:hypothetical protein